MANKLYLTTSYTDTTQTRTYTINDVSDAFMQDSGANTVKTRIKAINTALENGTSQGLNTFFRADNYDGEGAGQLSKISAAKITSEVSEEIVIEGDD